MENLQENLQKTKVNVRNTQLGTIGLGIKVGIRYDLKRSSGFGSGIMLTPGQRRPIRESETK